MERWMFELAMGAFLTIQCEARLSELGDEFADFARHWERVNEWERVRPHPLSDHGAGGGVVVAAFFAGRSKLRMLRSSMAGGGFLGVGADG